MKHVTLEAGDGGADFSFSIFNIGQMLKDETPSLGSNESHGREVTPFLEYLDLHVGLGNVPQAEMVPSRTTCIFITDSTTTALLQQT